MLESSIPERPFVNNVYRRSLALAEGPPPPPPSFPSPPVFSVYTYRRALLSERLEQVIHIEPETSTKTVVLHEKI